MAKNIGYVNTAANFSTFYALVNAVAQVLANEIVTANTLGATTTGNGFVIGYFGANNLIANSLSGGNSAFGITPLTLGSNLSVAAAYTIIVGNGVINSTMLSVGANVVVNTTTLTIASNTVANSSGFFLNGIAVAFTAGSNNNIQYVANNNLGSSNSYTFNPVSNTVGLGSDAWNSLNVTTTGTGSQVIDSFLLNTYRSAEYTLSITDNNSNSQQISKVLLIHNTGNVYSTEYGVVYTNAIMGTITSSVNSTAAILSFAPVSANTTVKGLRLAVTL